MGSATAAAAATGAEHDPIVLEIKDVSVVVPQRKKYDLVFTQNYLYARAPGTSTPVQGIVYSWRDLGAQPSRLFCPTVA